MYSLYRQSQDQVSSYPLFLHLISITVFLIIIKTSHNDIRNWNVHLFIFHTIANFRFLKMHSIILSIVVITKINICITTIFCTMDWIWMLFSIRFMRVRIWFLIWFLNFTWSLVFFIFYLTNVSQSPAQHFRIGDCKERTCCLSNRKTYIFNIWENHLYEHTMWT